VDAAGYIREHVAGLGASTLVAYFVH
jgi:hypothetical protein